MRGGGGIPALSESTICKEREGGVGGVRKRAWREREGEREKESVTEREREERERIFIDNQEVTEGRRRAADSSSHADAMPSRRALEPADVCA